MSIPSELTSAVADRYIIEREIGRGGMATVYVARDLRHRRPVALKLLTPEIGAALGVDRFLAEIRVMANLQHPNLLPLFDSGEVNGQPFYVMPYVDGESLRQRIDREKQLPVDEAVRIAVAVAGALDYAHAHGVVHRDLKPENILLQSGQPVVADFGIALALSNASAQRMTQTGVSLGTPQYMSPEQATGDRTIDARSDIYSLAAVTYEMLTGDPPHTGSTMQAVIARVLTERPRDVRSVRPNVSAHTSAAIERALEKLPADRWANAREFSEALQGKIVADGARSDAYSVPAAPASHATGESRRSRNPIVLGSLAAAALCSVAAVWGWTRHPDEIDGRTVRFSITPASPHDDVAPGTQIAISPDGRFIAFTLRTEAGDQRLAIREIGQLGTRVIREADPALGPFFSPDGTSLGFSNPGARTVRKVSLAGGPAVDVADGAPVLGATWAPGDVIVASVRDTLMTVRSAGGKFQPIARDAAVDGERGQRSPRVLDDGETILYLSWRGSVQTSRVGVMSLRTGRAVALDIVGASPIGVVDGHLIYATSAGAIMAVPFDVDARQVTGVPVQVVDQVDVSQTGLVRAAVSRTGSLAYVSAARTSEVVLADMTGSTRVLLAEPRDYAAPRFSPDGKRLAIAIASNRGSDVWIHDIASGTPTQLTSEGERNSRPEWTPDGKRVLYASSGPAGSSLWWRNSDFSGAPELAERSAGTVNAGVISPDGRTLLYWRSTPTQPVDILYRRLDGDTTSNPIAATPAAEISPKFSPDGKWVAYGSNQDGTLQVYVQPFPPTGARYQITATGGMAPVWSRDGSRIFYVAGSRLHSATIRTSPAFAVTARTPMFEGNYLLNVLQHANYDVSPDGKYFVLLQAVGPSDQIVVAHDWKYELRERMRERAGSQR